MKKGIGDKVLGWFVVQEEEEGHDEKERTGNRDGNGNGNDEKGREPEVRAAARVSVAAPVRTVVAAPVVAPGQTHDARAFAAVYRGAGVADDERERLAKVLTLLESLPAEASTDVKRAIVAASLEAFGVSIDRILVTGEGALAALDGYVVTGQKRTAEVLGQAEARIAKLTAEIDEVRRLMEMQVSAQQELTRAVTTEKARVREVVDFFDNGASGRAAPAPPRLVRLK